MTKFEKKVEHKHEKCYSKVIIGTFYGSANSRTYAIHIATILKFERI